MPSSVNGINIGSEHPEHSVSSQASYQQLMHKNKRLQQLLTKYKHLRTVQHGLLQLSELASTVTEMTLFYPAIHKVVSSLFKAENFYIVLHSEEEQQLELQYFTDLVDHNTIPFIEPSSFYTGLTGLVYHSGEPLLVDKAQQQQLIDENKVAPIGSLSQSWMGVPICRNNQVIGVMAVQSYDSSVCYGAVEVDILAFIATHLVTAINRVKSRELLEYDVKQRTIELSQTNHALELEVNERQRAEKLQEALFKISELTAATQSMDEFYSQTHHILAELVYAENYFIALLSPDKQQLSFPYFVDCYQQHAKPRKLGCGFTEQVINSREAILIDRENALALAKSAEYQRRVGDKTPDRITTSWLGAPLIIDGEVIGIIAVQAYNNRYQYQQKDVDLVKFVSTHLAVTIHRKLASEKLKASHEQLEHKVLERTQELRQSNLFLRLQIEERRKIEEKLYYDAHHDALTGLPNRTLFTERLKQALLQRKRHHEHNFAVLFIDLDRFKKINDTLGHHAGDQFLIDVSERITECIRDNDTLARLGGDEFVILLNLMTSKDDAEDIAQRIISKIAKPFTFENQQVYSGASIGIAACTDAYNDSDEIMRDADAAMYQAKHIGRGRYVVFDDSMRQQLLEELTLEEALHHAVEQQKFEFQFEPIVNLETAQTIGFQGNTYWQHPQLGKTPLADIIDMAESIGVMEDIDQLIVDATCQHMKSGQLQDAALVCLTLTPSCLTQPKMIAAIIARIQQHNLAVQRLCFQFEETALLKLGDAAQHGLKMLKRAEIKTALTGYGSGTMSLTCISQYPFDFVKLSGNFVKSLYTNQKHQTLLKTVIALSQGLGFNLIAQGITSQKLLLLVQEQGCVFGQGHYLGNHLTPSMSDERNACDSHTSLATVQHSA